MIKLFAITVRNMKESLGHVELRGLRARHSCPDGGWKQPGRWSLRGIRLVMRVSES